MKTPSHLVYAQKNATTPRTISWLKQTWADGSFQGKIPKEVLRGEHAEFWVNLAKVFARPSVSQFRVGAVVISKEGTGYLGSNWEYPDSPIWTALHAEQSACLQARVDGASSDLTQIWVSATPCGHCRQFLNEFTPAQNLTIRIFGTHPLATTLDVLLPHAFSMTTYAEGETFSEKANPEHRLSGEAYRRFRPKIGELLETSWRLASASQSRIKEAIVIEEARGEIFGGGNLECAAFNPSVPAITDALNRLNFSSCRDHSIKSAFHAYERAGSGRPYEVITRELLASVDPQAKYERCEAQEI